MKELTEDADSTTLPAKSFVKGCDCWKDALRQIKMEQLRKDIAVAVEAAERGEVAPLDVEDIIARGKKRLATGEHK